MTGIIFALQCGAAVYFLQRLWGLGVFIVECYTPQPPVKPRTHKEACDDGVEAWLNNPNRSAEYKG